MKFLMSVLLVLSAAPAMAADAPTATIPKIPFEKYTLPNGMDVILHEDHSTPIVGVNIWYHVGSKNEQPGKTGFAHLFEHMMFQGSKHLDKDYFLPLQKAGGRINGSTSLDRTNYWETVPSNFLELALWMESDRMAFLLPSMTPERLENQRSVVKNERRQSYENKPYGQVYETILAALLPPDHSYSWPTIGSMADLDQASREDVANFFRQYYHPANASLCIAGDFNPAEAKKLVEKYFAPIAPGPKPEKMKPSVPELKESKRIKMTDRVGLARLYLTWLTVPMLAEDDAELDVLGDVLAGGKTSRLYRRLVRDEQIAQDVMAGQDSGEISGSFSITATARPGKTLPDVEKIVLEEIKKIQDEPPTAEEISRAAANRETAMVKSLEGISEFNGRADRLNMYNVMTGDPGYLEKDFARYGKVTPSDVQRVAKKYLSRANVAVEVTPGKEQTVTPDPRVAAVEARKEMAKSVKTPIIPTAKEPAEDAARTTLPTAGAEPKFQLPPLHRAKLSNGMSLLVMENHETPAVSVHVTFPVGGADDPAGKSGLASLAAATWDEGTETRSSEQIAEGLADIGASLAVVAGKDDFAARLYSLKGRLPKALDILGDVLRNPAFPQKELSRQQNMALGRLMQIRNEATILANLTVLQAMYGYDHPYGHPSFGDAASLKSITRDDLKKFQTEKIAPNAATVIVVGDVTLDEAKTELERVFADWKKEGTKAETKFAAPTELPTRMILIDKPGAAQSVVTAALVGTERSTPDYFPLSVMNSALGGQFASRLNMNLREDKGYTYGARTLFDWRGRGTGTYTASASVQTAVTAPALTEMIKEIREIAADRPIKADEMDFCKTFVIRGFPANFETSSSLAAQLESIVQFHLPDDYFNTIQPGIASVTTDQVTEVAKKYLKPENLLIVVVGDREKVEKSLRELPVGKDLKVLQFDETFKLQPTK